MENIKQTSSESQKIFGSSSKDLKWSYWAFSYSSLRFPFTFDKGEDFLFISSRIVSQASALCLSACSHSI